MNTALNFDIEISGTDKIGKYLISNINSRKSELAIEIHLDDDDLPIITDIISYIMLMDGELRDTINSRIMTELKMKKSNAISISENINRIIIDTISKWAPISDTYSKTGILSRYRPYFENIGFSYLFNWIMTCLMIPMYHSLGDTIGYHDGKWEFNYWSGETAPEYVNILLYEFIELGGINNISIKNWKCSDDTILYLATMKSLIDKDLIRNLSKLNKDELDELATSIRDIYVSTQFMIESRHPGIATMNSLNTQKVIKWDLIPYDSRVIGAGSAMRSGFIGVIYHNNDRISLENLVILSIVTSIITHNSATAILGTIVAALFTSYSIRKVSINKWPHKLLKLMRSDIIDRNFKKIKPNDYNHYQRDRIVYIGQWEKYISLLFNGIEPRSDLKFMKNPVERYRYIVENFSKGCIVPGSCGDDCLIFAYDSVLRSGGSLEKLLVYSVLHTGDSDTIGSIAFGWFCGYYNSPHLESITRPMLEKLEFFKLMKKYQAYYMIDMLEYFFKVISIDITDRVIEKYKQDHK